MLSAALSATERIQASSAPGRARVAPEPVSNRSSTSSADLEYVYQGLCPLKRGLGFDQKLTP
jgi:hypothetical protein